MTYSIRMKFPTLPYCNLDVEYTGDDLEEVFDKIREAANRAFVVYGEINAASDEAHDAAVEAVQASLPVSVVESGPNPQGGSERPFYEDPAPVEAQASKPWQREGASSTAAPAASTAIPSFF